MQAWRPSRQDDAAAAAPKPRALGLGRMATMAAMIAPLALPLVRPHAGANRSGPTIDEISSGLSGLCRALGGIADVNPTRFPTEGGGSVLLNVSFKCKGGYLDGLNCKIGEAGDPTKGFCTFRAAPAPRQWASISRITNGTIHDLVSVNDLVQGAGKDSARHGKGKHRNRDEGTTRGPPPSSRARRGISSASTSGPWREPSPRSG